MTIFKGNDTKLLLRIAEAVEGGAVVAPNPSAVGYDNPDYSGTIAQANTPQDLCSSNYNRDRLTLQNLSESARILLNIDDDAMAGISFVIEPGGYLQLEEGEADKRISVASPSSGVNFVAKGRVKIANIQSA